MSKSDTNQTATLFLSDSPEALVKKIKSAVTDSERSIVFDEARVGLYNLLNIYKALSEKSQSEIEAHFALKSYGEFKSELAELVVAEFVPIQKRFTEFMSDKTELTRLMKINAEKAIVIAAKKVREVKEKIGFVL